MRELSQSFLNAFKEGVLQPIRAEVLEDRDLILELRDGYVNIYFKGHNLVELRPAGGGYACKAHEKFSSEAGLPSIIQTSDDAKGLVKAFPEIKSNITRHKNAGSEIEFEQMIVRANNYEDRLKTEYFILDRQLVESGNLKGGRPDLVGFFWPRSGRRQGQTVPLTLFEVKYGLNNDIKDLAKQLTMYRDWLSRDFSGLVAQQQRILEQKCELGLFDCPGKEASPLSTLKIDQNIDSVRYVVVLVDYNPHSTLLKDKELAELPFRDQITIFHVGFGLWQLRGQSLKEAAQEKAEAGPDVDAQ